MKNKLTSNPELLKLGIITLTLKRSIDLTTQPTIRSSQAAADHFRANWNNDTIQLCEEFKAIYVNRRHSAIGVLDVGKGGTHGVVVDIKFVLAAGILLNSSGIILSHNHPSGGLTPSQNDINITKRIKIVCEALDIKLLDHIILTDKSHFSFSDEGIL